MWLPGTILYPTKYDFFRYSDQFLIQRIPIFEGSEFTFLALTAENGFILDLESDGMEDILKWNFTTDIQRRYQPTETQIEYIDKWFK